MKIIFVETENEGHHITLYTRLLFKKLIKKNQIHFITSKKVINSEQYKTLKPYIKREFLYHQLFLVGDPVSRIKAVPRRVYSFSLVFRTTFSHIIRVQICLKSSRDKTN